MEREQERDDRERVCDERMVHESRGRAIVAGVRSRVSGMKLE
jgi:hypothetical protein